MASPTKELSLLSHAVPEYHKIVITSTSHPINEESVEAAFNVLKGFKIREKYNRHLRKEWKFPEQLEFKRRVRADPHAFVNPTIDASIDANAEIIWGDDGLLRVPSVLPDQKVIAYDEFKVDLYDFYHELVLGKKENTFAVRRLKLIEQNYTMHHILNEAYEDNEASKDSADFYKIVKVDNHIHAAGAMTIQDMLQFIQEKIRGEPNTIVTKDEKTLKQVLDGFGIPTEAHDLPQLSTDVLGMQAGPKMFHRFDHFNDAYNPFGKTDLRTIFMKTSNHIDGRFFAEITKNYVFKRLTSKYTTAQAMEPRLSIYGFGIGEWTNLAKFFNTHEMGRCPRAKWMIQVPRLAKIFMGTKFKSFGELLQNIFDPIVQATLYPADHPDLHILLSNIGGFDSVDDESEYDSFLLEGDTNPFNLTTKANPPYSYWMFMMSENLKTVNQLREKRGMNTFAFAPHCGESGQKHHCVSAFLTSDMINHGIKVNRMPVLTYMYYACQFGMALCPLSNDKLFLRLKDSPIGLYHKLGMNISVNTDDPLQFHSTADPIAEEYLLSAKAFGFNEHDMGEIASNSVRMSNFDHETKTEWHGLTYHLTGKVVSNQPDKTNVTDIRSDFRDRALRREHKYLLEKSSRSDKFQELLLNDGTGDFVKIGKYRVRNTYWNKQDELSEENTEKEIGSPIDANMKFEE